MYFYFLDSWETINILENNFTKRNGHTATLIKNKKIIIIGGQNNGISLNDIFIFNLNFNNSNKIFLEIFKKF